MGAVFCLVSEVHWAPYATNAARRAPVLDLLYVGLTIVVFAVLFLILKGVERFER